MSFIKRNRSRLIVTTMCFLSMLYLSAYAKSTGTIKIQDDRASLNIKNAPLNDVLRNIAEQAGILIVFTGDVHRQVSLNLSDISVEDALKRLLSGSNFSFIYQKILPVGGTPVIVLQKVFVFSDTGSFDEIRFGAEPDMAMLAAVQDSVPEDPVNSANRENPLPVPANYEPTEFPRVGNGIFVKASRNNLSTATATDLSTQFSGHAANLRLGLSGQLNPPGGYQAPEDIPGVQISNISKGSVMEQLGLKPGDVVSDINGTRITEPDQVVSAIHSALVDQGMMRIEVERGNVIEPIYVEME